MKNRIPSPILPSKRMKHPFKDRPLNRRQFLHHIRWHHRNHPVMPHRHPMRSHKLRRQTNRPLHPQSHPTPRNRMTAGFRISWGNGLRIWRNTIRQHCAWKACREKWCSWRHCTKTGRYVTSQSQKARGMRCSIRPRSPTSSKALPSSSHARLDSHNARSNFRLVTI